MQNLVITDAGRALMAEMVAGTNTANFSKLVTSDHDYSGADLTQLTALEDLKQTVDVSGVNVTSDTHVEVFARVDNTNLNTGYYIKAIGLFADDASNNRILYAVSIADQNPDWMPAFGGTTPTGYSFTFNVKVDNSNAVTITIDPAAVPSIDQFNAAVTRIDTAEGDIDDIETALGSTDISGIADGTVTGAIDFLHKKALLGHTAAERNSFIVIKDITDDIYDADSEIRAAIATGDFSLVNPGNYIIGKSTGTKYWVVDCDYWYGHYTSGHGQSGYAESTHHLAIMPQALIGNSGSLLWSGVTYQGSGVNNTVQGCAPWNTTNDTTGGFTSSYMVTNILPAVYTNWLKKDFTDQGIDVLNFYTLDSNAVNTSATCQGYSGYSGASSNWAWRSTNLTLPSIQNLTGSDGWQSSAFDVGVQKELLAIFKAGMSIEELMGDIPNTSGGWIRTTWTKNVAYSSGVCYVSSSGYSSTNYASDALGVRPLAFIA